MVIEPDDWERQIRRMFNPRHLAYFVALALFWGLSPALYRYWGEAGVPASHVIVYTGFGLAVLLGVIAWWRDGALAINRDILLYTFICAVLMNVPFSMSLTFARHVPTAELALVFSLSPLINFAVGAISGREPVTMRRGLAVAIGFVACGTLVLTRDGEVSGEVSWWLLASFINPVLYALYGWYAQRHWPRDGTTFSIGAWESFWSGALALPFMLIMSPPWSVNFSGSMAAWSLLAATAMWTAERIAFFTLIRERGASYTAQAVYLSAPAAVIFAVMFFGGATDLWLWLSLAILMFALYLNNSGRALPGVTLPAPVAGSTHP